MCITGDGLFVMGCLCCICGDGMVSCNTCICWFSIQKGCGIGICCITKRCDCLHYNVIIFIIRSNIGISVISVCTIIIINFIISISIISIGSITAIIIMVNNIWSIVCVVVIFGIIFIMIVIIMIIGIIVLIFIVIFTFVFIYIWIIIIIIAVVVSSGSFSRVQMNLLGVLLDVVLLSTTEVVAVSVLFP